MKPRASTAVLAVLLLCFTVLPGIFSPAQIATVQHARQTVGGFHAASLPSNSPFDYILIILMENKNFNQINGSASAPYLNQLAHNYSLMRPSQPPQLHVSDRRNARMICFLEFVW